MRLVAPSLGRSSDVRLAPAVGDDPVDAEVVEGHEFLVVDVPSSLMSGFTHFLDGAQCLKGVGYCGFTQMVFAHTSAAIYRRDQRQLILESSACWSDSSDLFGPSVSELEEYYAKCLEIMPQLGLCRFEVTDQEPESAFQSAIRDLVGERRKAHEFAVLDAFADGCLLIDGGIAEALGRVHPRAFVIGLVKSHQQRYFRSVDRCELMLGIRECQRTSVFLRPSTKNQPAEAFSFYLKLRAGTHQAPMFGLARVEMPAEKRYLEMVDEIASWILAERCPLSLPDPRFDVLLYPIHLVEAHLKARQPSDAAIRGLVGL